MSWPFDDNLPIYLQIMQVIKSNIAAGKYVSGEKLPSVRELAVEAGVNPNTMQRALSELEREGFLFSQRTSGRFVTDDKNKIGHISQELAYEHISRMVENVTALGYPKEEIPILVKKYLEEETPSQ